MLAPIEVSGSGPPDAKIAVVGEAPGKNEVLKGIPFCGPSGEVLWSVFEEFNIRRSQVYTTNVCKIRAPNDDIKNFKSTGWSVDDYVPFLFEELKAISP